MIERGTSALPATSFKLPSEGVVIRSQDAPETSPLPGEERSSMTDPIPSMEGGIGMDEGHGEGRPKGSMQLDDMTMVTAGSAGNEGEDREGGATGEKSGSIP